LEGLGQLKKPLTSMGKEPATFRLVAQCLDQLSRLLPQRIIKECHKMKGNGIVKARELASGVSQPCFQ
jgi:hypothetical protein